GHLDDLAAHDHPAPGSFLSTTLTATRLSRPTLRSFWRLGPGLTRTWPPLSSASIQTTVICGELSGISVTTWPSWGSLSSLTAPGGRRSALGTGPASFPEWPIAYRTHAGRRAGDDPGR